MNKGKKIMLWIMIILASLSIIEGIIGMLPPYDLIADFPNWFKILFFISLIRDLVLYGFAGAICFLMLSDMEK